MTRSPWLLQKTSDASFPLFRSLVLTLSVLLCYEHLARWCELPVAITMFECVLVSFLHDMNIELPSEDHVIVHGLGSDLGYLPLCKLKEGISA